MYERIKERIQERLEEMGVGVEALEYYENAHSHREYLGMLRYFMVDAASVDLEGYEFEEAVASDVADELARFYIAAY